jgi:uncharacterized protein YoxC
VNLQKQLEQCKKKQKKLEKDLDQINDQTFQLMQKVRSGCLEDDVAASSSKKVKKVANKKKEEIDSSSENHKDKFSKLDQKTIDLADNII